MYEFLRKDLLLVVIIAAAFLSVSYGIGYVAERRPQAVEVQPAFLAGERAPRAQTAAGRVWREHGFDKLLALGPAAAARPVAMRVDEAGNIYVLDWADFRVKMFSPGGDLLKAVGEGKGTGAGAFINPTGFSVGGGGEVWVCDPPQRKITRFGADGGAHAVTPQSAVDRIAAAGGVLVTMAPPRRDAVFEVYNPAGDLLKSFGEIIEDQFEKGIILDGNVIGDGESREFIYGGRYAGVIGRYGTDGAQRFLVQTIDGLAPPKILNIGASRELKPDGTQAVMSMSVRGEELYVLSGARADGDGGPGARVMDVYDKREGNYLFSLRLPMACTEAVVRADNLYTLGADGVTVWRLKPAAAPRKSS